MTSVNLKASGYTWRCPECKQDNYTGAAPSSVSCSKCNGLFSVKSLVHRRERGKEVSSGDALPEGISKRRGGNSRSGQQTLFEFSQDSQSQSSDEDIPF
jgi:hypothetical protein